MGLDAQVLPGIRKDLSDGMTRAHMEEKVFTTQNYLLNREPDFYVYLYNVSEQKFEVSRPPIFQKLTIPGKSGQGLNPESLEKLKANGGQTGDWILATRLPSPLVAPKASVDSSEIDFYATDTRRFAMDIVNPDNLGIDQDAVIDPKAVTSQGNNLGAKGVFWSLNFPPKESEVKAAIARMERGYQKLIEEARAVEVSSPAKLHEMLGPEHHSAADYFGEVFSWHGKKVKPADCPNCGERIKAGSAFHKTDEGTMCIINWPRAVSAGVRTRAQAFDATGDPQFAPKDTPPVAPVAPVLKPRNSDVIPSE